MPPKFEREQFTFETGEIVPDHIEGVPILTELNGAKLWLEEVDPVEHTARTVAIDVDDLPTANMLQRARTRHLEQNKSFVHGSESGPEVHVRTPTPVLKTREVADLFHVAERTITDWALRGRLPSLRTLGGHRRYPEAVVKRLFKESGRDPSSRT